MNALRSHASRLLFWAAAAFSFVMAVLPHPPELPGAPSDKIQHIAAFITLGLLSAWAFPRTQIALLVVQLSLFGALIELVQAIPMLNRDSDPIDWLTDTVACGLALLLAGWWRRRAEPRA